MECVVTGGAGFIGSHLVDRLLGDGHKVVVIDNFVIGRPENLASHAKSPRLKIVNADVTDLEAIRAAFRRHRLGVSSRSAGRHRPLDRGPDPLSPRQCRRHGQCSRGGPARRRQALRLCGVVVLLRHSRRLSDAGERRDPADVSLRAHQISRRAVRHALVPGLQAAGRRRCACSTFTGRALAPPAPTAPCSASSWRRSSPESPSRWSATASRRATSPSSATSPTLSSPRRTPSVSGRNIQCRLRQHL